MTRNVLIPTGLAVATLTTMTWAGAALAQPNDGYVHHPHMWSGSWGGGMIFGPLVGLLFIAVATAVVVLVVRAMTRGRCCHRRHGHMMGHGYGSSSALSVLEERYAKGEIDTAEFNERKKALTGE